MPELELDALELVELEPALAVVDDEMTEYSSMSVGWSCSVDLHENANHYDCLKRRKMWGQGLKR